MHAGDFMSDRLDRRLNRILPKITSDAFLRGTGLGNEIAFHIFDYPPEEELRVRQHLAWLINQIPKEKPNLRVMHINLFEFLVNHLRTRGLLDKAFELQREKGNKALEKALKGPLHEEKIAEAFATAARPEEHDLVIVAGVGSAYPLIRSSSLLSNLQSRMGTTPLLLFYPGRYDGIALKLFGKTSLFADSAWAGKRGKDPYYRAFQLIPEEPANAH